MKYPLIQILGKTTWIQQEEGDLGAEEDSTPGGCSELDSPPATIVHFFHNDHLGTSWSVNSQNQLVSWAADYYPFGEVYDELANTLNPHRFPGQLEDPTTDLNYNWRRYYSPELGRYYQADPIGNSSGDFNQYRYSLSNPLSASDPFGLASDRQGFGRFFGQIGDAISSFPSAFILSNMFVFGIGPETIEFGQESLESRHLANSVVVSEAISLYEAGSFRQGQRIEFDVNELLHSLTTGTLMDDFVGSLDSVCIAKQGEIIEFKRSTIQMSRH